jgi:hypothetical protein
MKELARIVFTENEEELHVECNGQLDDILPALTMGAADVMCSVASQVGMSKEEAVDSFCAAFRCAVGLQGSVDRVDMSGVAQLLRAMGKIPPKQE